MADVEKIAAELRALVDPMAEAMPDGVRLTGLIQVGRALLDELDRLREAERRAREVIGQCADQMLALYSSISPGADYVTDDHKRGNRFADHDRAFVDAKAFLSEREGQAE